MNGQVQNPKISLSFSWVRLGWSSSLPNGDFSSLWYYLGRDRIRPREAEGVCPLEWNSRQQVWCGKGESLWINREILGIWSWAWEKSYVLSSSPLIRQALLSSRHSVSPSVSQSVQSLSRVRLFATPWIAARQASLSITNSQSSHRLMSIESVMPSSHLILCRPLLLLSPIPPSIRVFSNDPQQTLSSMVQNWKHFP